MSPVSVSVPVTSAIAGSQVQQTVSNSVVGVSTIPSGAIVAEIQVTGNGIYLTDEGSTPSSTKGFALAAGDWYYSFEPGRVKMIRQSADATVNVCYYS